MASNKQRKTTNLPGSCQVLGGDEGREKECCVRHKSVEDGETEIIEHQ